MDARRKGRGAPGTDGPRVASKSHRSGPLTSRVLAALFSSNPTAMAVSELPTGKIVEVNEAFVSLTLFAREELVGREVTGLGIWADPQERERYLELLSTEGAAREFRCRLRRKDGELRDVVLNGSMVRGHRSGGIVVSFLRDVTDQLRLQKEIAQSEERYRRITSAVTDYIYTVHIEGGNVVRTVHGAACEAVTGYTPEDFERDPFLWYTMIFEDDREAVREHFNRVTTGERCQPIEHRIRRKDGTVRWVSNIPVIHRDASGNIVGYDGVLSDITERKLAEKELKESEERFKALHEASFGGIGIHDRGLILDCNRGLEVITGYSREELIGMNGLMLIAPSWREHVMEKIVSGYERPYDVEGIRKDGTIYPLEIQGKQIPYHGKTVRVTEFRDITWRKRIEDEIRVRQARIDSIFRAAPVGIGMVVDRVIQEVNDRVCEMTGYSREELTGVSARVLYPDDDEFERVGREKYVQLEKAGVGTVETRWKRKDGSIIHIILSSAPIDPRDPGTGYTFTALDITMRKLAEDRLKESEERYRLMAELTGKLVYDVDLDTGRHTWDGAVEVISGYTREEFASVDMAGWTRMIHPEDRPGVIMAFERALDTRKPFRAEYRILRKDDKTIYVEDNGVFVTDKAGRPYRMLGSIGDITARRLSELALKESEERYRNMFDNSHAVMLLVEPASGAIVDANPAACSYYGYSKNELVSMKITDINTLSPREIFAEMERARSSRKRYFNFKHRLADGVVRDVEVFSGPITVEGRTLLFSIVHDVTDRRLAEEALRRNEERFRQILQNIADIIVILDSQGRITYETPSLARVLGYAPGHLVGASPLDLVHPEDKELVARDLAGVYEGTNNGIPTEFRMLKADGTWIYLEAIGSRLEGESRQGSVIITARDVTDRKKAEGAKMEMERRMLHAQRLESLGVLAGGIAHNFNNLLMAILGNIDLARIDVPPGSRAMTFLDNAMKASRRAADLTNQMLAYSGRGRSEFEEIDLSGFIQGMTDLIRASISKGAVLTVRAAEGLPPVKADPDQIRQVVMNLVVNASEAIGDAPGSITVSTDLVYCSEGDLSLSRLPDKPAAGEYVVLEVRDTGCGMDENTLELLFDPFFSTKFTGRGLGMAAVSGIVKAHKGAITVESEPGKGTTFRVYLPVAPGKGEPRGGASERDGATDGDTAREGMAGPSEGFLVLVVDDEDLVRETCASMISRLGHRVLTASDGMQALEIYKEKRDKIACVVLDLTMPVMDGIETLAALRRMDEGVKVILSSGYDVAEAGRMFEGLGATGFIKKPYSMEQLRRVLEGVKPG